MMMQRQQLQSDSSDVANFFAEDRAWLVLLGTVAHLATTSSSALHATRELLAHNREAERRYPEVRALGHLVEARAALAEPGNTWARAASAFTGLRDVLPDPVVNNVLHAMSQHRDRDDPATGRKVAVAAAHVVDTIAAALLEATALFTQRARRLQLAFQSDPPFASVSRQAN